MVPPVVLDIDGTLTMADANTEPAPIDPRCFQRLRNWGAPVILATGKAFPAPVVLCQCIGLPIRVVAETGGIACDGDRLAVLTDTDRHEAVLAEMRDRGHTGGDALNLINRWRETETAFTRDVPLEPLRSIADANGLEVVDTGYAYHVKDPTVSKGAGLVQLLDWMPIELADCVAIGDSANDVSMFDRVGHSIAVANAHASARTAADEVSSEGFADGALAALDRIEGTAGLPD